MHSKTEIPGHFEIMLYPDLSACFFSNWMAQAWGKFRELCLLTRVCASRVHVVLLYVFIYRMPYVVLFFTSIPFYFVYPISVNCLPLFYYSEICV
ncbi:hypothetical protein CPSG_07515 [Coccidioides posadasii str. Silveira]|uniref:Uncharacterized protein n=1 Tax=Coccidioides posadasii (strain RMSCC 757 / Silveira) TaxID=443226 RepID=E9DCG3_COCPS|nr:hypothetical protein CPSG_07515 [Coccidioides posadasii str. Silveira]